MAWQGTYDAYGAVATAEELQVHPRLHVGHKGLFLDRLDVGVVSGGGGGSNIELPRLVPFGHSLCYNRNRTYAPGLGRFLQSDPNATAMAVMGSAAYHAQVAGTNDIESFSVESLYGDGHNIYEYLSSSPWLAYDALGLAQDPFDIVDDYLAEDAATKAAFFSSIMKIADVAIAVGRVALVIAQLNPVLNVAITSIKVMAGYPLDQALLEVAGGLIGGAVLTKIIGGYNRLMAARAFQKSERALGGVSAMYRHVYKMGSYRELKQLTKGYKHEIQAHHLLEVRHARKWGLDPDKMPAVILTKAEHAAITKDLRRELPYLGRKSDRHLTGYSPSEVLAAYRRVYAHRPEWLSAIESYFR